MSAHKLTPVERDVTAVVSDQWSRFTAPSIDNYNMQALGTQALSTQIISNRIDI